MGEGKGKDKPAKAKGDKKKWNTTTVTLTDGKKVTSAVKNGSVYIHQGNLNVHK